MTVKIVSIGPVQVRPDTTSQMASRLASVAKTGKSGVAGQTAAVEKPVSKDGIQITLAAVDVAGRYLGRQSVTVCDGALTCNGADLGSAPDAMKAALATVFAEVEKTVSALLTAGKISL